MDIQTIKSESGDELVVIPKADYMAMRERLADLNEIKECDEIVAAIDAGEETYPHSLVLALIEADRPVTTFRKYRGMTMKKLADRVGVSRSYISKIESGEKTGTIKTLKAIANALDVGLDEIC